MAKKKGHGPPIIDEKRRKLKDIKNDSYRASCSDGYQAQGKFQHAHHVIPCCSMAASISSYFDSKAPEYRRALYYFTDWNINVGANLLGLPTLAAYEASFRAMRKRSINVGRPHWYIKIAKVWALLAAGDVRNPMYPIHSPSSFGHLTYSDDVERALDAVWDDLSFKAKDHEPINANDLASVIQAISDRYRGQLKKKDKQRIENWDDPKKSKTQFFMA